MKVVACGQGAEQMLLTILLVLDLPGLCFSNLLLPWTLCVFSAPSPTKNVVLFFGFEKGLACRPHFG